MHFAATGQHAKFLGNRFITVADTQGCKVGQIWSMMYFDLQCTLEACFQCFDTVGWASGKASGP